MQVSNAVLRLPAVKEAVGLSTATIYVRMANGEFPKPIPLGGQAVGWLKAEVEKWLADRVAERV